MTREQLLETAKPVLFNTDMVNAILDERKTSTRRIAKGIWECSLGKPWLYFDVWKNGRMLHGLFTREQVIEKKAPYKKGDILYVRETYCWCPCWHCGLDAEEGNCDKAAGRFYNILKKEYGCYVYKASFDGDKEPFDRWYPSIHMPKEAARIFLKVTDVKLERLQDMDRMDAVKEGIDPRLCVNLNHALTKFKKLWNSTVKKSDLDRYGWDANPWVWVIEFERVYFD